MRLLQKLRKSPAVKRGFTLVEMLVVAPLVLIVLAGLIAAIVGMIGDSLAASGRTTLLYSMQDSLDRIEQDSRLAINYLGNFNYFTAPQGRNGDATAFDYISNEDLILTQQSTTASPYDASRLLVYYANQPTACPVGGNAIGNRVLTSRVVYFLRNGSLWRRTIVNPWNTNGTPDSNTVCNAPWQRDTCPLGSTVGSGPTYTCNGIDEELLTDVTDFTPTFYKADGSSTTNPSLATIVRVSITVTKNISGESVTQTSTIRATRRNDVPATPVPDAPAVSVYNPTIDTYNNPILVSFQWSSSNATSYSYQTSTDGTNWTAATPTTNTYKSVDVDYSGRIAYIRVTAYNDQGSSTTTQASSPSNMWMPCGLQNNWANYQGSYPDVGYTVTSTKIVVFHGLAKDGNSTSGTQVCSLPTTLAPDKNLRFATMVGGSVAGRIDVGSNGSISIFSGASWVSFDTIRYPLKDAYSWSADLAATNSWVHFGDASTSNVKTTQDSLGRKFIRGIGKNGTTTSGTNAFTLPSNYGIELKDIYVAAAGTTASDFTYSAMEVTGTVIRTRGIASNFYWSLHAMWWPSGTTGWNVVTTTSSPALQNSWVAYDPAAYSQPQYKKGADNIVSLRGLIKNGTMTNGTVIFKLKDGNKPTKNVVCAQSGNNPSPTGYARVDVYDNGDVVINGVNGNGYLSLAGCDFIAEH